MSKLNYSCSYCSKHYIMKSAYNNHLLKCKFAHFSSKFEKGSEKNTNSETITIDSLKQNMNINNLFAIVIMLYNKYEKMESDYNELKKYIASFLTL